MAIKDLFVRLLLENKQFKKGIGEAGDELKDFGKQAGGTKESVGMLGSAMERYLAPAALLGFATGLAKTTWELGELGARADAVEAKLTAFAGSADEAAQYTNAVEQASNRTVDSMTAMSVASGFLQMGIADTEEEMRLYVEGAVRLGDQTQDAGSRIDSMTQLLKNQSVEMLDNFGLSRQLITARTEELQATQDLSREEAMLLAIQEELSRQLGILGPQAQTDAGSIDQLDAALMNLKLSAGNMAAPAVGELSGNLAELVGNIEANLDKLQKLNETAAVLYAVIATGQGDMGAAQDLLAMLKGESEETTVALAANADEMDGWMQAMHGLPEAAQAATAGIEEMAQAAAGIEPIEMSMGIKEGAEAELLAALNAAEIGAVAGGQLLEGLDASLQKTDAIGMLAKVLSRQVTQEMGAFRDIGRRAWGPIEAGFVGAMQNVNFLQQIAAAVSPLVAAQMQSDQTYGGEY